MRTILDNKTFVAIFCIVILAICSLALSLKYILEKKHKTIIYGNEDTCQFYTEKFAKSGSSSFLIDTIHEYGPTWSIPREIISNYHYKLVKANFDIYIENEQADLNLVFASSTFENGTETSIENRTETIKIDKNDIMTWKSKQIEFYLLDIYSPKTQHKIYFWNINKGQYYIDNVQITFE